MISARHNGMNQEPADVQGKQGGLWKGAQRVFARHDGQWKTAWEAPYLRKAKNMIRFSRASKAPIVPNSAIDGRTTWYGRGVLNSSVVVFKGRVYLYFRAPVGNNEAVHDLGVWHQDAATFDPWKRWVEPAASILKWTDLTGVNWTHAQDRKMANPEALVVGDEIYLYIMMNGATGTGIGVHAWAPTMLLKSTDGINFTQVGLLTGPNPATTIHTGTPGVVHDGTQFVMACGDGQDSAGGFFSVIRTSSNGLNWSAPNIAAFPRPDTIPNSQFDGYSWVSTRFVVQKGFIYAFSAGGPGPHPDWPEGINLYRKPVGTAGTGAWEEYTHNPVMLRGDGATPDGGAIWCPCVIELKGRLLMFYEGVGPHAGVAGDTNSNTVRDTAYHQYNTVNYSNQMLALCDQTDLGAVWAQNPIQSGQFYTIRSMANGAYLCRTANTDFAAVRTQLGPEPDRRNWLFLKDDEFFAIRGFADGPCLEIANVSRAANALAQVFTPTVPANATINQEWHLIAIDAQDQVGGLFFIQNRYSGLYLTSGAGYNLVTDNAQATQQAFTGAFDQQWAVIRI